MMSSFTTEADMRILDKYRFKMLSPFEYHVGAYPSKDVIRVPKGFVTDLASTPRALWWIFPPHGKWAKAAIVHDYLYVYKVKTKAYADNVFYEAMGVLGVPDWQRKIMYLAVRLFGRGNY